MVAQKKAASKKPAASTKPVWQKLFVKGGTVALIAAPAGYDRHFTGSPARVSTRGAAPADTVVLFAKDSDHLETALPGAIARLAPGASLWVAYRKGGKELHRDTLARRVQAHGYSGVSLIAVDDAWSALRVKKV